MAKLAIQTRFGCQTGRRVGWGVVALLVGGDVGGGDGLRGFSPPTADQFNGPSTESEN